MSPEGEPTEPLVTAEKILNFNLNAEKIRDPVSIRIIDVEDDHVTCQAGDAVTWEMQLLDAEDKAISPIVGKLEVSWAEEEISVNEKSNTFILPEWPPSGNTTVGNFKLNISFLPQGHKKKLAFKLVAKIVPGEPHALEIEPDLNPFRAGTPHMVGIRVKDKFGNFITQRHTAQFDIELTCPVLSIEGPIVLKDCEFVTVDDHSEENYWVAKLSLFGRPNEFMLVATDPAEKLLPSTIRKKLGEGQAEKILVNKQSKLSISMATNETMEPLTICIADQSHNICKQNAALVIEMEGGDPFESQLESNLKLNGGICSLVTSRLVKPGDYVMNITSQRAKLEPCSVHISVTADEQDPSKISLTDSDILHRIQAGHVMEKIEISVTTANDEIVADANDLISLRIKHRNEQGPLYKCTAYNSETESYHFNFIEIPQTAGKASLEVTFENIFQSFPFDIHPGPAHHLEVPGNFNLPESLSSDDSPVLFESLEVSAVDQYGNSTSCRGQVSLSLQKTQMSGDNLGSQIMDENSAEFELAGNCTVNFGKAGKAKFEKIEIGKLTSGGYDLVIESENLTPKILTFLYTDTSEILGKKDQLSMEIAQVRQEMKKLQSSTKELEIQLETLHGPEKEVLAQMENFKQRFIQLWTTQAESADNLPPMNTRQEVEKIIKKLQAEFKKLQTHEKRAPGNLRESPATEKILGLAASQGSQKTGVVGVVYDILCDEDANFGKVIARLCGVNLYTVILDKRERVAEYYDKFKSEKTGLRLVSVDDIRGKFTGNEPFPVTVAFPLKENDPSQIQGYVSHVINRINLKKRHEYLRRMIIGNLLSLGTTMIFDTMENARNYRAKIVDAGIRAPILIALDEMDYIETSGVVTAGDQDRKKSSASIGSLPPQEMSRWTYLQDIVSASQSYAECLGKFEEISSQNSKDVKKLELKLKKIEKEVEEKAARENELLNKYSDLEQSEESERQMRDKAKKGKKRVDEGQQGKAKAKKVKAEVRTPEPKGKPKKKK
eukprot:TRINITY_DN81_c1_g1_i3.p1 TRINITY_DN81_c1_g1~~TRINITY_DN81_c1_g1_i3.p1  ORF type:complete len:1007 (-),score=397.96 TRINITY_DN81_c1_g1_i3:21-3041(-)